MNTLGLEEHQLLKIENDFAALPRQLTAFCPLPTNCSLEELICLKFLMARFPASDWATYPISLFLKAVRNALSARRALPWGGTIPVEEFFSYVLPPRINNEDLSDCREPFFLELFPRVKNLSLEQAALEVNYWCLEKATYRSTDIRTNSPLSVLRSAYGRCGEESTLCVAALRSVCIPARQCYTPRWAHCDDNHAWVEVWTGTEWHCLGACEPEPVLDRGWFLEPASRGMLIHAKAFSHLLSDTDITIQTPVMSQVNILNRYAEVKRLQVSVKDFQGNPVVGARVRFQLVNYAELYPLADLTTDDDGMARLTTGFGGLVVHVSYEGRYQYQMADRTCQELSFCSADFVDFEEQAVALDLVPPVSGGTAERTPSPEMLQQHEQRLAQANRIRQQYEESFLRGEAAQCFGEGFPAFQTEIADLIALSNGNHPEIARFLREGCGIPLCWRVLLLQSLKKKDLADSTCALLSSHLQAAYPFREQYPEDIFVPYLLCPRVAFELLSDYREALKQRLTPAQQEQFSSDPAALWHYLEQEITDCGNREYVTLTASPVGLLDLKYGSKASREILFVAICRTLGIPARLNALDGNLEYWRDGDWKLVTVQSEQPRSCHLTISSASDKDATASEPVFAYEKNFTIAKLENGVYRTLGQETGPESSCPSSLCFPLEPGCYRVTTANRLRDGTVLTELIPVKLAPGESLELRLTIREPEFTEDTAVELPSFPVCTEKEVDWQTLLPKGKPTVLAFVQEGAEPTEHLLNEILEQTEQFAAIHERILFLIREESSLKNALLQKALQQTGIPTAIRQEDGDMEKVLEALSGRSHKLPLVLGINKDGKCIFHLSGYNVGTGDLLLRHLKADSEE